MIVAAMYFTHQERCDHRDNREDIEAEVAPQDALDHVDGRDEDDDRNVPGGNPPGSWTVDGPQRDDDSERYERCDRQKIFLRKTFKSAHGSMMCQTPDGF